MKKKILLFSRSELTYLYGSIDKYLKNTYDMLHIAYSDEEEYILKSRFGIQNSIHFKNYLRSISQSELSKVSIDEIDTFLLETTTGKFNVNGVLQANRTSQYLSYEQNITLLKTYYVVWREIFNKYAIDIFIHEPVSLLMNQIAASFCKKNKAVYSTHILCKGEIDTVFNYIMVDDYMGSPTSLIKWFNTVTASEIEENRERIENFVMKFRQSLNVFFAQLGSGNISQKEYLKLKLHNQYSNIKRLIKPKKYDPVIDNIELFMHKNNLLRRRVKNLQQYKSIVFEDLDTSKDYYYYPMHLEPEAVVLYWGNNKYTNQIKLIENIAAQLPPDTFLYVKDHPHSVGYRIVEDYLRLKAVANIKLLKTSIPGKEVIHHSKGVITINGTGGFEALMMNKHVIMFGTSFYQVSNRVYQLDDVFKLRELLYSIQNQEYKDDDELYMFVLAYLKNLNHGFTDFYNNMHNRIGLDLDKNAQEVASSLSKWINFVVDE